ncbi:hypothetical protein ACWD4J_35055 [Streptomyces sp. NPDC002577]
MTVKVLVDVTVLASVLISLALGPRALARRPDPDPAPASVPAGVRSRSRSRSLSVPPLAGLAAVTVAVYLNQVLFTVYVLRVHGGNPSFIARYLPTGWFELAVDNPALRSLAEHFPAPALLAPSVLRVQAFVELPFVLLAFATVLRWLDADVYRRTIRSPLLPLAALSYTAVFCTVEWDLHNPYTADDLVIRAVSAVLTPPLMARMAARDTVRPRPLTAPGLLLFIGSLGALGVLVLVVYDTALLYNLGRLDDRLPLAVAALGALIVCRLIALRLPARHPPGPAISFVGHALRRWLSLFLVPALAVRYGVTFGTPQLAAGAGLLTATLASLYALRDGSAPVPVPGERDHRRVLMLLGQLGCAVPAGAAVAYTVVRWTTGPYYEATLLQAMAAFLVTAIAVCALTDRATPRISRTPAGPPPL